MEALRIPLTKYEFLQGIGFTKEVESLMTLKKPLLKVQDYLLQIKFWIFAGINYSTRNGFWVWKITILTHIRSEKDFATKTFDMPATYAGGFVLSYNSFVRSGQYLEIHFTFTLRISSSECSATQTSGKHSKWII